MTGIGHVLSGIIQTANANAPASASEYLGTDGLMHCGECGEAVQCRINLFGEERTVRCICSCTKARIKAFEDRVRLDGIQRIRNSCFQDSEMQKWVFSKDDRRDERLSRAMRRYAAGFTEFLKAGKGLLLYGRNGTGKSFFSACIANALIDSGYEVYYTSFSAMVNALQGLHDGKQEYINSLSKYSLVVFDDLGAERQSEYMQEQVFSIVDARYCSGLPFIVTTNLTIEDISKPQDTGRARIYSRILERCFPIEVNGIDRRKAALKRDFPDMAEKLGLQSP